MRIVFFGTPEFAVASLEALAEHRETVTAVVTQPDRSRGRSHSNLQPPPVKDRALSLGIPVIQPGRPAGPDFAAELRALDVDLGVVVAYGHLLKPEILAIPRLGMINVHASLLPAWRGAAPIQWSIAHGDTRTGVSIMQMEAGLDSGPVLLARDTPIGPDETGGQLTRKLARLGAGALIEALGLLATGAAVFTPQDVSRVTLAPKIGRETGRIDWSVPAATVANRIRAFDPVPGAWTSGPAGELKCFRPSVVDGTGAPGTILDATSALVVAAGDRAVSIREVQPSGRPRMSAAAWLRGRPVGPAQVLR